MVKPMNESIGRWAVGKDKCFTIYQGILPVTYLIKEPTGIALEIYHDSTKTKLFKATTITAKKIWIEQYPSGKVEGTYELDGENKSKEMYWYVELGKETDFANGDDSGSVIYRICGPENPCDQHETKKEGCKKCEVKKGNIIVSGVKHGENKCLLYNNETTDVSDIKIRIKGNYGQLPLTGKAFAFKREKQ